MIETIGEWIDRMYGPENKGCDNFKRKLFDPNLCRHCGRVRGWHIEYVCG